MGALTALGTLQSIIFLPIITKILGAEDYGIWSQIQITMSLLVPLTFLGLCQSLGRFLPGEKDEKKIQDGVYSSLIIISGVILVLALFLIIFAGPASVFFRFAPTFIKFLSLIIIFESLNTVLLTVVLSRSEVGKYFWFSALKMLGETGLVIYAIFIGYGLYGAILALLFIKFAIFLVLLAYVVKKIGIKIPNFSLIKDYLKFGLPTVTNGISYGIVTSADRYIIGFFLGVLFVGYYAPAYSLGMLLTFFIFPVMSILTIVLPRFFDENNLTEVKNYLGHSFKYFLLIMIPAVFGVSILSSQLLLIFSTKEIAGNAHIVVPFIAASMLIYGIICFFVQILILVKKTKIIAIVWGIAALLNLGFNIIFIPRFGIISAAIVTLMSYVCALVLMWYFSFKEFQFRIDWEFIIKIIMASVLMSVSILWFNPLGLAKVIGAVILGVIIYCALILLLKCIDKKEINFFKKLIYEMVLFSK
jgi:O-antigen/teichoic acid export membrane protein